MTKYPRVVEKIPRSAEKLRLLYELVLAGIRVILKEGWRSFWEKFRHWWLLLMSGEVRYHPRIVQDEDRSEEINTTSDNPVADGKPRDRRTEFTRKYVRGIGIAIGSLHGELEVPPNVVLNYVGKSNCNELSEHYSEIPKNKAVGQCIIDDVTKLEKVKNESCDFVICNHLLEYVDKPVEAISNWLRVLRPGGIIYLTVYEKEYMINNHIFKSEKFGKIVSDLQSRSLAIKVIDLAVNITNGVKEYIYVIEKADYIHKIVEILEKTPRIMEIKGKCLFDVIVPVYNAYEDFEKCLYSLFKHQDIFSIILIDDCSTDKRVKELLRTLREHECERFRIIENEENVGYVKTVNKGMKMSKNDILLLNTDTIVTKGFGRKMRACAYSHDSIATVTPFTNNGMMVSIPEFLENNDIPEGFTIESFAECVEMSSLSQYPELVTAVGFCMYIKRDAIDEIGYFDEVNFEQGYGEEGDFSARAMRKGCKNVLCDNTFIFHKGRASFLDAQDALLRKNHKVLAVMHPGFWPAIARFEKLNPLKGLHDNLKLQMSRWNISCENG